MFINSTIGQGTFLKVFFHTYTNRFTLHLEPDHRIIEGEIRDTERRGGADNDGELSGK